MWVRTEFFHLGDRDILVESDEIFRFRKLLFFVSLFKIPRILAGFDFDFVHGDRRLPFFGGLFQLLGLKFPLEEKDFQSFPIFFHIHMPFDIQADLRPILETLARVFSLFRVSPFTSALPYSNSAYSSCSPPPTMAPIRGKRRGGGFDEEIADHLKDDLEDAELGIIQAPRYRDIQVDFSFSVFQKGNGKFHGELRRLRAFNLLPQGELIEKDFVLRLQVFLDDQILEIHRQLRLSGSYTLYI